VVSRISGSRKWRVGAALATLVVSVSACGEGPGGGVDTSEPGSPISVAFELPLTGAFAANGLNQKNGFELGLDTFGREVDGHPIEVRYIDTKGDPATALTSARQIVQEGVTVFEGPLVSSESAAVTPYLAQQNVPVDDLTLCSEVQLDSWQKNGNGYSSGWSCDHPALMAAKWAYEDMGWRNITIAAQDFSFGWEVAGGFKAAFESLGGTINQQIWVPLNATDVSSYVSQIPQDTDAVYAEMSGVFAVRFTDAYKSYGLTGKVPLLGITQLTDQSVLPQLNREAALGVYTGAQYCDGIDTSENKEFVDAYQKAFNLFPGYYSDAGYVKAEILVEALKSLDGDYSDPEAVAKALQSVNIKAPRGPVEISDKTHSPIQNVYICQVQEVEGQLRNVPIKTFDSVPPEGPLEYDEWEAHFRHDSAGRPE
jgi:branched-chain amino acid transport system substrate-binding protein